MDSDENPAEAERPPSLIRRGWNLARRGWDFATGTLPLIFAGLAIFMVMREAAREPIEVSEISVPSSLSDTGLTGAVAAHRLLDAINATAHAVRTETMHRPSAELEGSEPDLNIPAAGLSLRGLAALVRNLLGWPQRKLSGEIIVTGDRMRFRMRMAGHGVIADVEGPVGDGADALLLRAAPEVWRAVAPRLYAWYIAESDAEEQDIRDRLILLRRRTEDPEADATIDFLIARSLVRSGRADDALDILNPMVEQQPGRAAGHYGRALALRALGDREGALLAQRQGLALDPASAWAHLSSAVLLRELGRFEEALAAAREAQRLDDDDPDGLTEEAHILRFMGRLAEAAAVARRAVALDPSYAPAHAAVGHALLRQREDVAALAAFDTALRLAPHLADGHTGRGQALAAMGREPDAMEALARAIALDATDHRPHHVRAELLGRLGQWSAALEAYDEALVLTAGVPELHLGRGVALSELGRRAEAIAALRQAFALGLNDAAGRRLLTELEAAR
ncbi:tetratricopeptide repeat protein [Sediminicoccus sp. KRV36]|uniref:tetratricopeptide repeat protein n=1 Tax=Sediminicoccus sp. KRV36 TaxID=3133721 RepID=UPI00200F400F|nr:tetratricopeptide repeat protein [Sediminicoccus rosea]UPY37095.1 tetratricopeptide repeat protein [Sediminicoccus rosea]